MENFTDLFGDDLSGLDGLGEFGNFSGQNTGAQNEGGDPSGAPQQNPPQQAPSSMPMDQQGAATMMGSQYPQQQGGFPAGAQKMPGGYDYQQQYRPMGGAAAGQQQSYSSSGFNNGPPGYPGGAGATGGPNDPRMPMPGGPRMASYGNGAAGMMGGPPGAMMSGQYPNYGGGAGGQPSGQMYPGRQMAQGMPAGAWGQSGYPPGSHMRGQFPGGAPNGPQSGPNFRHQGYPGASEANSRLAYPGSQQQPQNIPPHNYPGQMPRSSSTSGAPQQYPNAPHMNPAGYPGGQRGHPQAPSTSNPGQTPSGYGGQYGMPGAPNQRGPTPSTNQQQYPSSTPPNFPRQPSQQQQQRMPVPRGSSASMGSRMPTPMPPQQQPSVSNANPSTNSNNPPGAAPGPPGNLTPLPPQPPQQTPSQPGAPPSGQMYRPGYPQQPSPHIPPTSSLSPATMSPKPMSPATSTSASSPAPANTPNSMMGGGGPNTPGGNPPTPGSQNAPGAGGSGSSLQQLEQMVMPGSGPAQQPSGPSAQTATSPMPTKNPQSPSVRGPGTPLSPQQWNQQQQQAQSSQQQQQKGNMPKGHMGNLPPGAMPMGPGGMPMGPRGPHHPSMMMDPQRMPNQGMHPGMYGNHQYQQRMRMPGGQPGGMMPPNQGMPMQQGQHPHMMGQQQGYPMMSGHPSYQGMQPNQQQGMPPGGPQHMQQQQQHPGMMPGQQHPSMAKPQQQVPEGMQMQQQQQQQQTNASQQPPSSSAAPTIPPQPNTPSSQQPPPASAPPSSSPSIPSGGDAKAADPKAETKVDGAGGGEGEGQPDRETSVVTPKLDEDEYKSDYKEETSTAAQVTKADSSEQPSNSDIAKAEEPSSTTSPLNSAAESSKPDSSSESSKICDAITSSEPPPAEGGKTPAPGEDAAKEGKPDEAKGGEQAPSEAAKPETPVSAPTSSSASVPTSVPPTSSSVPNSNVPTSMPNVPANSMAPSNGAPPAAVPVSSNYQQGQQPIAQQQPGGGPPNRMPMQGYGPHGPPRPGMPMHPGMHPHMQQHPYGPGPHPQGMPHPMGPGGHPMRPDQRMPGGPHMGPDQRMHGPPEMMGPRGMMRPGMPPQMMGQNGPMHPGQQPHPGQMRMPMHPIQMEMQHLHQQLNHLYSQPQNPQIQQQIQEMQGRMQHLQQQMSQMPPGHFGPPGPGGPQMMGPGGPMGPRPQGPPGAPGQQPGMPPGDPMGPPATTSSDKPRDIYDFEYDAEAASKQAPGAPLDQEEGKKGKKGAKKAPKTPKEPKPPKEKKPKKPKAAKEPKGKKGKKSEQDPEAPEAEVDSTEAEGEASAAKATEKNKKPKRAASKKKKKGEDDDFEMPEAEAGAPAEPAENANELEEDPATPVPPEKKEKKPKIKSNTPKKPKPNKTLLQFAKKKRKRSDSGSDLDLDATPPPSPKGDEDLSDKRRSGRNTKRKKYTDDINLSEDEELLARLPPDVVSEIKGDANAKKAAAEGGEKAPGGGDQAEGPVVTETGQSGPNYAFIDPTAEDTMIVQYILATRMGTRELESDDEDEPKKPEVAKAAEEKKPDEAAKNGTEDTNNKDAGEAEKKEEKAEPMETDEAKPSTDEAKPSTDEAKPSTDETKPSTDETKPSTDETKPSTDETKPSTDETKPAVADDKKPEEKPGDKAKTPETKAPPKPNIPKKPARMIDVEEYLVKFKNFSYLHCQWNTEEELHRGDKRIFSKIKRFKQKREKSANVLEFCEEEPFNPDYVEVDRVLDSSEHVDDVTKVKTKHFLVKWRSLPYEECTWELESDVDPIKIKDYYRWREPQSDVEEFVQKRRGRKHEWKKWDESPPYKNNNTLRPYQLEGVNWLLFSWFNGRNCLLADEMGLGKTIQSLCFLDGIFQYGIHGPFLVIAPLSTIPNWQREFELWSDMNVIVYHGSQTSRNMLAEYEMYYKDAEGERRQDVFKFHVLITTYECVITDILELREIQWRACVIDEAHRLKNQKCKLLEGLNLLEIESRLLLSGTPLQNNIHELYSLLSFLEPSQFSSQEAFIKDFGDMQNEDQVNKLQALLKPLMLRRMKEDVEKSLKPKEETIVEVELTNIQKKYYRGILEKNFSFLQKGSTYANVPNLMNTMMELRKCCIHPYLLNGAEEQIQDDYKNRKSDFADDEGLYFQSLINSSGKMVLLDKLLPKLKSNGHRVLIFSQMVKMLDILEDYLVRKQYPYERIDGRIRGNLRQAAIDRYCKPGSDRFIFLLCTKAGGLGINLVAADTCIIYDSDWNPQNDLQAQARCHRIGQAKSVKIYRLITRNTYEREMFDRASLKLGLDKAVLQSMNTSQGSGGGKAMEKPNQLSKKEIEDLLKKGAYGALMDDDNAGDKFCEEDIEHILQRRTTTVAVEQEKAGGSFSKASFASNDTEDISIDDPDFWAKWAKKAEVEEIDEKTALMVSEPRSRKKIQRFGGNETLDPRDVSELDSTSDSDDDLRRGTRGSKNKKLRKRGRRSGFDEDEDYMEDERDVEYGEWSRRELFRIENNLLNYGWGRWSKIVRHASLRKGFSEELVEDASRIILLYCLNTYRGDEKIKAFVWDLITPKEYGGSDKVGKNHSGLSGPVPRGRKGRKGKGSGKDLSVPPAGESIAWVSDEKYDMEMFLDKNYRKHLDRHGTKLLLRIRLLYYLQHDLLVDFMERINTVGVTASSLKLNPPPTDGPPCEWWDSEADKSLLVGTVRHGYERYNMMRLDPDLCFLDRCGPPDSNDIQEELKMASINDNDENSKLEEDEDSLGSKTPSESRASSVKPDDAADAAVAAALAAASASAAASTGGKHGSLPFPHPTDLNGRLRRLITAYQREHKKEEQRQLASSRRIEKKERIDQIMREREQQRIDMQQRRWTSKEETEFLRTVLAFGVEYSRKEKRYVWDRFKQLARLDKKYDETITEYFLSFIAMCKRVCGNKLSKEEELLQATVEPISEEKAKKVMERIELLNRVREEAVTHPDLEKNLDLCDTAQDLPAWWIPGVHDKDLLFGVARHGLSRLEYYVLNDPELSFKDILKRHLCGEDLLDKKAMAEFEKRMDKKKPKKEEEPPKEAETKKEEEPEKVQNGKEETASEKSEDNKSKKDKEESPEAEKKEAKKPKSLKERKRAKKEEEQPAEEIKETRARRKSTKDSSLATSLAIEAVKMAKAEAAKNKEKKNDKEAEKEDKPAEEKDKETSPGAKRETRRGSRRDTTEEKEEKVEKNDSPAKEEEEKKEEEKEEPVKEEEKKEEEKPKIEEKEEKKPSRKRFSVSIPPPQISMQQMEQLAKGGMMYDMEIMNELMAQTYAAAIKWPKDKILEVRLQHIMACISSGKWPVADDYPLGDHLTEADEILTGDSASSPEASSRQRDTATPLSEGGSEVSYEDANVLTHGGGKRVRGRKPLDYADEKSKIRNLLQQPTLLSAGGDSSQTGDDARAVAEKEMWENYIKSLYSDTKDKGLEFYHPHGSDLLQATHSSTLLNLSLSGVTITPVTDDVIRQQSYRQTEDGALDLSGGRGAKTIRPGVEITPVNGDAEIAAASAALDLQKRAAAAGMPGATKPKTSKLESALDKIGMNKRKLSDETTSDKSKKKKRLDDIMFGLGAAKGVTLDKKDEAAKKEAAEKMPDLNKLQEMLGGPTDTKVQKWLADQMGVVPERPTTPQTATGGASSTATSSTKSPKPSGTSLDWMSSISGEEHVTVFNRFTGKKLSGSLGPKLKTLAQWLIENPMFEVDPKWAEMAKSKIPSDQGQKRKGPGRPPLDAEPSPFKSAKTSSSGVGPSFSTNSMAGLGLDPKNPLSSLTSLDPKNPMSLAALYGLDPKKLDPMTAAMLGMGDPKNPGKLDPMMLAALGMDSKTLQSMGIDPKTLGMDPKAMQGLDPKNLMDPKTLQAMGIDPKALGLDSKTMQAMGMDPKALASMGLDQKTLQSMGLDQKTLQSMGLDQKTLQSMGLDSKALQSMGLDSKALQSMGLDSKALQSMGLDSKALASMGLDSKTLQAMGMDPKALASMGMDPKLLQSMGLDAKALQSMGLDPKALQSMGMDQKTLQAMGMDPKMLQAMGMDPKSLQAMGMDPKMLQAMGMDSKTLQAMGMDPKALQAMGMDPKALQAMGMDPKTLQAMGMDPKSLQAMGLDSKALQAMGMDPKVLQSMGLDPKTMASLGMDPKALQAAMGMDPKLLQSMGIDPKMLGLDPKSLQAMGLDSKALQAMGLDPKLLGLDPKTSAAAFDPKILQSMGMDPKTLQSMGIDAKALQAMGIDSKTMQAMGIDPKRRSPAPSPKADKPSTSKAGDSKMNTDLLAQAMGLDPKKLDPATLAALGLDPKNPKMDAMTMAALGLDPKNPNSASMMAAMAAMDPTMAAMYGGYGMPGMMGMPGMGMPGMDLLGLGKGKSSSGSASKDSRSAASPRGSRASPSPRPPSRASSKSDDRRSPRSSAPVSASTSKATSSFAGLSAAQLGIDPKMLSGMDPKLLQAAGIDPKTLNLDPKSLGLDNKNLPAGFDPKMFAGIDPKLLAGIDPKMLDPKMLAGLDPKMLAGLDPKTFGMMDPKMMAGFDPKLMAGMDPKLLAGLDPKMLAGMDPKLLFGGMDPKQLGIDPKLFGLPSSSKAATSLATSFGTSIGDPRLLGLDPKMLQGLDSKSLQSLGLDPSVVSSLLEHSRSKEITSKTTAKITTSTTSTFSSLETKPSPSTGSRLQNALDPKSKASSSSAAAFGGLDPKLFGGMDPKAFGLDPKTLAGMDPKLLGFDPKLLAGMDPKMLGLDPKMFGLDSKAMGKLDPKMLGGLDPKLLGFDPKMFEKPGEASKGGFDIKSLTGLDPKSLAGLDPKLLGMDSKTLASLASMDPKALASMDPKLLGSLDPSIAAMYSLGLPPTSLPSTSTNGISSSSKGPSPAKPKPGTVAAALAEKKGEKETEGDKGAAVENNDDDDESRKGLTSEERVLLREKKRQRLRMEQGATAEEDDSPAAEGDGLNLSASQPSKLDSLLGSKLTEKKADEGGDNNVPTAEDGAEKSEEGNNAAA